MSKKNPLIISSGRAREEIDEDCGLLPPGVDKAFIENGRVWGFYNDLEERVFAKDEEERKFLLAYAEYKNQPKNSPSSVALVEKKEQGLSRD